MTWVIAASSIFGYGVMISDVRVEFPDGRRADLVRKAYPVGPYLVAGFAGSVAIGFSLIGSLQRRLVPPDSAEPGAWEPTYVANNWPPVAKDIFENAPPHEKALGSRLLLLGVSPTEHLGVPEFPRPWIIRFASPHFVPGFMSRPPTACHIGAGSEVRPFKRMVRNAMRLNAAHVQLAGRGGIGPAAALLARDAGTAIQTHDPHAYSPSCHYLVCRLGEISGGENNARFFGKGDGPDEVIQMPVVASSYREFLVMCQERRTKAAGARA